VAQDATTGTRATGAEDEVEFQTEAERGEQAMRLRHTTVEQGGMLGGRSFIVKVMVELSAEEQETFASGYGVYETIELGERFKDVKGVSIIGDIRLSELVGRQRDFKLSSIQLAGGFVDALEKGLGEVRAQILATRSRIKALGTEFAVEIG
jgi:hypothetical protein